MNLTDLADRFGSDKGTKKHRYTELYQMLFMPYRSRKIKFLEMGLQLGGPGEGFPPERMTTDIPSIRMWLEYFPKAQIFGLDISDFSSFENERFTFFQCDLEERKNISAVAEKVGGIDIIIDDASHASHHQQNAFLELFPTLSSGGLYIIEDLNWQPQEFERDQITKTSWLFHSYVHHREFKHADKDIELEFRSLQSDISGCFLFQNQFQKKRRDKLVVIHKK